MGLVAWRRTCWRAPSLALLPEAAAQHGAVPGLVRRLVHVELVGVDRALHDVLPQAVRRGHEDHVAEPGLGVEGEHDPGAARSARTIFMTPTDSATLNWSKPWSTR